MTQQKHPKVFISYSWATHKERVIQIAHDLMRDGIDTIIDEWNLKHGQDKYKFMEQMVTEPSINFVLIMCDKSYTQKADSRAGGVGDETAIISSELYGKIEQTKFIPIILEKDENGTAYCPVYLKNRIHLDFSNTDDQYEQLLRILYGVPLHRRPELGKKPEWLSEYSVNISSIQSAVMHLKNTADSANKEKLIQRFPQRFIETAKQYIVDISNEDVATLGKEIEKKIYEMKPLRDLYLDTLDECIVENKNIVKFIILFFEQIYNGLLFIGSDDPGQLYKSRHESAFEHYKFIIWNCFVCTILYLRRYEKYMEIHTILTHTFFLQQSDYPARKIWPSSFIEFRPYLDILDGQYGKQLSKLSLMGDIAVKLSKYSFVNQITFSQTDVFICQLSFIFKHARSYGWWFPITYIYLHEAENMWVELTSRKYCEKLLPLFNVNTIEELKKLIEEHPVPSNCRYPNSWQTVMSIPLKIQGYEFCSLP